MIYPIPPVDSLKDLIAFITLCDENDGFRYECDSTNIEGKNVWTLWTSYLDGKRQFSFIKLYKCFKDEGGWGFEQLSYEAEFEDHLNCPGHFLDNSEDSVFIDQSWRDAVRNRIENRRPENWDQCLRAFNKIRKKGTGERVRIYFDSMRSKRAGKSEDIPYADLESTFPLRGRYKGKLYELKRACVTGFEILPKPQHPRGHIES